MPAQDIRLLAKQILDGEVDILAGCRAIVGVHRRSGRPDDEAMLILAGVEAETDEFPVGKEREAWDADALNALDGQRCRYLDGIEDQLRWALHQIEESP